MIDDIFMICFSRCEFKEMNLDHSIGQFILRANQPTPPNVTPFRNKGLIAGNQCVFRNSEKHKASYFQEGTLGEKGESLAAYPQIL